MRCVTRYAAGVTTATAIEELARALPSAVGPMSRLLRRAVAVGYGMPRLPDAQVDLLRLVEHRPGISVAEAAEALQVAPNTVSTLVRDLEHASLLDRRQRRRDRRVAELHLTASARERLEAWGRHRQTVLEDIVARLSEDERAALAAAVPAMERLQALLVERAAEG